MVGQVVGELLSPVGGLLPPGGQPVGSERLGTWRRLRAVALGEVAALGDGGDVGPVVGENGVEDVAGLGQVGGVGDDVDAVVVASSGGGDVQAAVGGGRGDEGDADIDGVALMAVLGGRVPQPDMLGDVVGRQRDGPAAFDPLDGECSVAMGRGDEPLLPVADGLTVAGGELPVVAAGDDDLTDMRLFAAGDGDRGGGVKVTGVEAGVLDGVVQCVDVLVAAGRDRHRPPGRP